MKGIFADHTPEQRLERAVSAFEAVDKGMDRFFTSIIDKVDLVAEIQKCKTCGERAKNFCKPCGEPICLRCDYASRDEQTHRCIDCEGHKRSEDDIAMRSGRP